MSNPATDNIRRSLGRTERFPLSPRPAIYASRQAGSTDSEIQLFLNELEKLSGVGRCLAPSGVAEGPRALVANNNILKATVWNTPHLSQLQIADQLESLGVEIVSPTAEKHELAQCDLGVTEADYLLNRRCCVSICTRSSPKGRGTITWFLSPAPAAPLISN